MFVLTGVHYIGTAFIHVTVTGKRIPYIILGGRVIFLQGFTISGWDKCALGEEGRVKIRNAN